MTAQEVFVWAHGKGVSGKDPSPVTIGARMACLSSFFRFLIRMDIVAHQPLRPAGAAADLHPSGAWACRLRRSADSWPSFPTLLRASGTEPSSSLWYSPVAGEPRSSA